MTSSRTHAGLTLLELLVVIAVIGIVVALLLPAVQQVRATARTVECLNNARQLGIASINFHDIHGHLPTAPLLSPESPGWALDILPQLEQAPLWGQFDLNQPVDSDTNALAASSQRPSTFHCPQNQDNLLSVVTLSGASVEVRPNHYTFNAAVLGVPMARIPQTDNTMLARDSGSIAQVWNSSPFVSVFDDDTRTVHPGGTVVVYVSGRAGLRANGEGLIVELSP